MATIRPEFIVERQGKKMILYPGLLHEAHEQGLVEIATKIIQFPTKDNEFNCIVVAEVVLPPTTPDGPPRHFSDIGDASPANVGRNIVPHYIRMASTRAKARTLRDALDIGDLGVDETDAFDDAQDVGHNRQPQKTDTQKADTPRPQPEQRKPTSPASAESLTKLYALARDVRGWDPGKTSERLSSVFHVNTMDELAQGQVDATIQRLEEEASKKAAAAEESQAVDAKKALFGRARAYIPALKTNGVAYETPDETWSVQQLTDFILNAQQALGPQEQ